MLVKFLLIFTIITIWVSLFYSILTIFGGIRFLLKHTQQGRQRLKPLPDYPKVTIVVPAHNEELVIVDTISSILHLNYPERKMEILVFADNCTDQTYEKALAFVQQKKYADFNVQIIKRTGTGGKSGVLNDALAQAKGEWICVYDADAMPEKNSLYFLIEKAMEDPEHYRAAFGRNKTRNAKQNFLTRCINLEIMTTHRIFHTGMWELFKIGHIPGTNFIIHTDYVRKIGGWDNGALTEDTALSFKIMRDGKLVALAEKSEAFQQEPESLSAYYHQRKRWAKGNYEVILTNFKSLFERTNWRIKWEVFYYINTFFWFNLAVVLSDFIFISNLLVLAFDRFGFHILLPFTFGQGNALLSAILLVNWALMLAIYLLQINLALASQYGQATTRNYFYSIASYFTYSQLFLVVSLAAFFSLVIDKLTKRDGTKWYKTQRFDN